MLAVLLLGAALLVGSLPAGAATGPMVRLGQLTPELKGVELTVSSVADPKKTIMIAAPAYGQLSPYQAVEPGDYVIALRPTGSTEPAAVSRTLAFDAGSSYTVAAVSPNADNGLAVFTDDLTPPPAGQARMRIINAGSDPVLDVQPLAPGLARGQASPYRDVPAGATQLTVGPPGGATTPLSVDLPANQVSSIVLTTGPRATVMVDAAGPAVVPPGPVHAGYGGTADQPGGPIGSIVLVVLAAVAGAVSLRLARRTA